jgi:hypothetical protein
MTGGLTAAALVLALMASACGDLDRGRCLRSHVVAHHTDEAFECLPTVGFDGMVTLACATTPARDWTVTICDEWEFPQGKAERD